MPIEIEQPGPAITADQLDEFEAALPGPLPPDYRAFLLQHNGGYPAPNRWPPEVEDGDLSVHGFLGLRSDDVNYSLAGHRQTFTGRIPDRMLGIGFDEGGNQLCLSLTGDDQGFVYLFDHELEQSAGTALDPELLQPLAASFSEFFATLGPEPSDDGAP